MSNKLKLTKREIVILEKAIHAKTQKDKAFIDLMWANWSDKDFKTCLWSYIRDDYEQI